MTRLSPHKLTTQGSNPMLVETLVDKFGEQHLQEINSVLHSRLNQPKGRSSQASFDVSY